MRLVERQKKVEKQTKYCLDIPSKELNVKKSMPSVYWIGRKLEFEELQLPEHLRDYFEDIRKTRSNIILPGQETIFIGNSKLHNIAEESMHYLHFLNSGMSKTNFNIGDYIFKDIVIECIGYFGSKLIYPKRKHGWTSKKDNLAIDLGKIADFVKIVKSHIRRNDVIEDELLRYQQGYNLGERLFVNYARGKISKKEISNLINTNLNEDRLSLYAFLYLKTKLWPS